MKALEEERDAAKVETGAKTFTLLVNRLAEASRIPGSRLAEPLLRADSVAAASITARLESQLEELAESAETLQARSRAPARGGLAVTSHPESIIAVRTHRISSGRTLPCRAQAKLRNAEDDQRRLLSQLATSQGTVQVRAWEKEENCDREPMPPLALPTGLLLSTPQPPPRQRQ